MIRRRGTLAFLLAATAACGGGSPDPGGGLQPGILTASLFQPNASAGALLLSITGGIVTSVTAANPGAVQVSFASQVPGTTRVVVTGALQTGDLLKVAVADVSNPGGFTVRVDQVADNVTFALVDTGPYSVILHK